jgi:hypothetical protein
MTSPSVASNSVLTLEFMLLRISQYVKTYFYTGLLLFLKKLFGEELEVSRPRE